MTDAGYSIIKNVFSSGECDTVSSELSQLRPFRGRAGVRHLMSNPRISALAYDSRLLLIASEMLGDSAIPYRATLFDKSARANWLVVWHQDTALPLENTFESKEWGPWSTKAGVNYAHAPAWALNRIVALRVHIDSATTDNGSLRVIRVIPGSHLHGLLSDEEVFEIARTNNPVICEVDYGGVMTMRPLLIHSSSKGISAKPRRVIHIEYADSLALASNIHLTIA
jgi:ectoine hydroxylase-related dioxygenase (phytanoyl-CoA dioxygenase family)